jgi:UDP-2,3-diacylglucosamine hydrolase
VARTLFISDLHLDSARPAVTRALAEFLSANTDCDALYILGDLFEAWIGDDDDAPLALQIRELFAQFSAAGPRLYLMHGNRDFLIGEQFCRAAGATLLDDPTVIDLYGHPTLLMHGDSLCSDDAQYQAFRLQARDPQWQQQLLSQDLPQRRALAQQLRSMSQEANSNKAEDIMDVNAETVRAVMTAHSVDRLIHGHTHRPAAHQLPEGKRWVLGDWESSGWFIEVDNRDINLIYFDINQ